MKFSYEDLISGDSINIEGVGHIRSPKLFELKPTQGIGTWMYGLYLNMLSWEKEDVLKFMKFSSGKKLNALMKDNALGVFDTITIIESSRKLLQDAMAFFMEENLQWDDKERRFNTFNKETKDLIGSIDRNNYDFVREIMLQVNYISVDNQSKHPNFSSDKSKKLWEEAQKHLRESAKQQPADKRMQLGNIISKLSCVGVGYTLLNIYDLTVFQLYDQFFQYGYLRAMDVNDMAFCNHGGKNFDIQAWLKPITNFEKEKQQL